MSLQANKPRHLTSSPVIEQCPQTAGWICESISHRGVGETPDQALADWQRNAPVVANRRTFLGVVFAH